MDQNNNKPNINSSSIKEEAHNDNPDKLPEGWEEHWDEHLQRYYYMNNKLQKVTWKHPKAVFNQRAKFGKVQENNIEDWHEEEVQIDKDRTHYEVDDEEECEGGFNLTALVKKVEEQEAKREAAEDAGEEFHDSDDGMFDVAKQKKKKKQKKQPVDVEEIQKKIMSLTEHTMVGRASMKKDYTLLEGHFLAVKELDPVIDRLKHAVTVGTPPDDLLKTVFEVMLGCLDKAATLSANLRKSRVTLNELNKLVNRIATLETGQELLDDAIWVSGLLKTM